MTTHTIFPLFDSGPLRRRTFGSFLSAFVGWVALLAVAFSVVHPGQGGGRDGYLFYTFFTAISAAFVFPTWLVALLPLYLFVPSQSFLWRWPVCTICGVIAGAAIMFVLVYATTPQASDGPPFIIGASIVGGVSCLFGSLTRPYFHGPVPPNNALQRTQAGGRRFSAGGV